MDLIVQPGGGVARLLEAVNGAQKSLDISIFRLDLKELENAVEAAVERGVKVRALIAHTNSGGEKRLRQLELRMLQKGVTVNRTDDELVRYHAKMLIVDREELHVYGFNFTALDIKSRSFGIVTRDRKVVQEAVRLFESDCLRQEFEPGLDEGFVVSPENAREQLATFIKRARKSLCIYDPRLADPQMIRLLQQRVKHGVDVRVIGKLGKRGGGLRVQKLANERLHVRAMVRDGETAFVGSQSLRSLELDMRREVGVIVRDPKVVKALADVFEQDWARTELGQKELREHEKAVSAEEAVAS